MRQTGILPDREIAGLFQSGMLIAERAPDGDQIQPASLDLRLGAKAYRVRASFLPGPKARVEDKLDQLKLHEIDLSAGAVLETGCVYVVPLLESLDLPDDVLAMLEEGELSEGHGRAVLQVADNDGRRHLARLARDRP